MEGTWSAGAALSARNAGGSGYRQRRSSVMRRPRKKGSAEPLGGAASRGAGDPAVAACRLCRSKTRRPAQRCQHGSMTEPFENICQTDPGVPDHRFHASAGSAAIHLAADPASRRNLALFDSMEHFVHEMLCDTAPDAHDVSIHSRPIRRLTEAADGEGSCGLPLPSREGKLPLCCRIVLKNTLTAGGAGAASLERRVPAAWSCGMEGDEERK